MIASSIVCLLANHKIMSRRYDGSPALPYWRAEDFGVSEERFSFKSGRRALAGSRYFVKGQKPQALVVFFHGIGDGRASYIREIALMAKKGYLVYAYDNTGSMESEGRSVISLDHTQIDQKYFFRFLDSDPKAKGLPRYAIGHSWGGYGALTSAKPAYKIEKIVSLAGYVSFVKVFMDYFPKWAKIMKPVAWFWLKTRSPSVIHSNAISILRKSNAKILYIQGDKDKIVKTDAGYIPLRKAFSGDKRFKFLLSLGSGHSVYRDPEAERYTGTLLKSGIEKINADRPLTMDLGKATKENEKVWEAIFDFLAR